MKILLYSAIVLLLNLPYPSAQATTTVNLGAVVNEMGKDLRFRYRLVKGSELLKGEVKWEARVPYGVKDIYKLKNGNLLVITRDSYAVADCERIYETDNDDEYLSFFSPEGVLLNKISIGGASIVKIHQSDDGSLISLEGGYHESPMFVITDGEGKLHFKTYGKVVPYPSSRGDFLVNGRSRTYTRPAYIVIPGGERRSINIGRLMNIDGSDRSAPLTALGDKERDMAVLWSFGDKVLLIGDGSREGSNILTYYDTRHDRIIWNKEIPFYPRIVAASHDSSTGNWYTLGNCSPNELKYRTIISSMNSGEIQGAIIDSGGIWDESIGSQDGCFYANIIGGLKKDDLSYRVFLAKIDPRFNVICYGLLWAGNALRKMKHLRGYVWGMQKACTLAGNCYPIVTPIYDMRGGLSSDQKMDLFSRRVDPVILEGYWFIYEMNDQYVTLVGQLDRKGGVLRMIRTKRGDIGL